MDSTLVSALTGLLGTFVGAGISWFASIYTTNKNLKAQEENLKIQKEIKIAKQKEIIKNSARIIYLDFYAAISEGIRVLKKEEIPGIGVSPVGLSFCNEYSKHISNLTEILKPSQLIILSKFYGILEKTRHDILQYSNLKDNLSSIDYDYLILFGTIFGEEYKELLKMETRSILIDVVNSLIYNDYRELTTDLCNIANAEVNED